MFATRAPKANKNKRRRATDDDDDGKANAGDEVVLPAATDRRKVNTFSTGAGKRAKNVVAEARLIESAREIVPQKYAGDATYESHIDTAKDRDARAILERNLQANADGSAELASGKVYKGQAAYMNYIPKNEAQIGMNKYTGTQGPIRAQTWARAISRFDYQPDICKDYKETGFCGYGDSCKFLHDRGDYKSGWQIEREHAEKERKKQQQLARGVGAAKRARNQGDDDDEDDDDPDKYVIPSDEEDKDEGEAGGVAGGQFACTICRAPFRDAVETLCGHYFCEACALAHFRKSSRCFTCKKQTNGVFKAAGALRAREQQQSADEEKEEDAGEEDRSDGARSSSDAGEQSE